MYSCTSFAWAVTEGKENEKAEERLRERVRESQCERKRQEGREKTRGRVQNEVSGCRPAAAMRNCPSCMNLSPNLSNADNTIFTRNDRLEIP